MQSYTESCQQSHQASRILNSIPVACYELDESASFVYLNAKAEDLLKLKREDAIGRSYWEVFPQLIKTECYKFISEGIQLKRAAVFEHFCSIADTWVRMEVIPNELGVVMMVTDFNEMQGTRAELLEEQRRHKLAQEVGKLGYFEQLPNSAYWYWSDELYQIHGLEPQSERMTIEKLASFIHPEDQSLFWEQVNLLHETRQPIDIFTRIIRKDGDVRILHRKAQYLTGENNTDRIYGTVQDVTDEYQTKHEQKRSEDLLNAIFETLPMALSHNRTIKDKKGKVIDFVIMAMNEAQEKRLQTGKKDAIGRRLTHLFPGIDMQPFFASMKQVAETGVSKMEEAYMYNSEKETWSLINTIPLEDGVMVAAMDITERKQAEIEKQKAFQILETVEEAVLEFDSDSRLVYLNKRAASYWNIDRNELEGKKLAHIFSTAVGLSWYNAITKAIYQRIETTMEFYSPIFNSWTVMKLKLSERGAIVIFSDIQKRKIAEEKIKEQAHFIKRITEIVPDLITVREIPSRKVLYFNDSALLMTEFHADHIKSIDEYYKRFAELSDDRINSVEFQARQRGNDWMWFRVRGKVFQRDETGKPTHVVNVVQNITLQKEAQRQLKENIDLLQSLFDTTLMGMAIYEAERDKYGNIEDFRVILMNRELEKLIGHANIIGELLKQKFPDAERNGMFEVMLKVVETGKPAHLEYSHVLEGQRRWFSSMFVKLNDGVIVTNLDITERKLAEEEKFKNLTILQQSEEVANMGSWEYDRQTGKYQWSDGMYRLFELQKGGEIQPEIYRKYATDRAMLMAERVIFNLKSGAKSFEEILEIKPNGRIKIIKLKATVIFDETGVPQKVLGVDMDISAMKQAEDRIKEDTALINGIADAAPDMLYVIDIRSRQLVYANNIVLQLFQKTIDEIKAIGSLLFEAVIYPADREKFEENIKMLERAKDNEVKELVYRLIDGKGIMHWIKTRRTVYKRDEDGVPTHIIGISQDITTQVKLKEKNKKLLKDRKRMAERQQEEIFRATLSTQEEERKRIAESLHNGLGQLLYGVKLNMGQVNINRPDLQRENQLALQQTSHLLAEAIKESRRISHELMPSILEDFGLRAAIEDICKQFNQAIHFKCQIIGQTQKLDKFLQIAIYRIVQELMMNIVKHSEAKEANVIVDVSQAMIQISVRDNGVGFEMHRERGKGIGLKTIQSKVKLLNGNCDIISADGKGTSINIAFPNKTN